jgi:AraC-like DNA-binding protein
MKNNAAEIVVDAQDANGILLERYAYTSGAVEPLSKHAHEEYQFGLSFDCQGEYHYRGVYHTVPTGSLSIIHSGEVHSPSDRSHLHAAATFWMMHIHPNWMQTVFSEMTEKSATFPFFSMTYLSDATLNQLFLCLHAAIHRSVSQLEQDVTLCRFLSQLIFCHAENHSSIRPYQSAHTAVLVACEYLQAHYADDISLEKLAAISGLSRFHFCRVFRKEIGLSPSVYQTQLRIAHAKKLLLQGSAISTVASLTGFYDQSHFGSHFKRQVGVTPGQYASKTAIFS